MFRRLFLPAFLLTLPCALVVACGVDAMATGGRFGDSDEETPSTGSGGEAGVFAPDGSFAAKSLVGSPLCGEPCLPDFPDAPENEQRLCGIDGGAPAPRPADASVPVQACRIVKNAVGQSAATTSCEPASADLGGVDGTSCKSANDCAPGFDCVDGEMGAVCRRYCCAGTCEGYPAQNGGATFCDVQAVVRSTPAPTLEEQVKAPVCMPIKACTLLEPGACGKRESCAVVTEKGATGCVANGAAQAGKSCDAEHCAEGLTCLGSPGDRTCYKLCKVGGADCGPTQKCTSGSTFQDTNYGVCKD